MKATYSRFPDVNILPQEYRRRTLSRLEWGGLALLLVVAALLPFSLLSFLDTRDEVSALQAEQRRLVAAADKLAPRLQEAAKLRQEITTLQANLEKNKKAQGPLLAQRVPWDPLLSALFVSLPWNIELTSVVKGPKQIAVDGMAHYTFSAIAQYYSQLKTAPGVSKVTINKTEAGESKELGSFFTFSFSVELAGE